MNAEPIDPTTNPHDEADYAALARDVRYLKAAVATITDQMARRDPTTPLAQVTGNEQDEEERAILAYLNGTISQSEREEALAALAALAHAMAAESDLTEDELAGLFDATRSTTAPPR